MYARNTALYLIIIHYVFLIPGHDKTWTSSLYELYSYIVPGKIER